jgi:hypothetical protein
MGKKLFLVVALLFLFLGADFAIAEISVGVKEGDWIEYNVSTTGNPVVEHDVTWARLEILEVQGNQVNVNVTTRSPNGTLSSLVMVLDLEKGQIGAWWIIPANLSVGDEFYDEFLGSNITIEGSEQLTIFGAPRTITNATTSERTKRWDKSTGIFILSIDNLPDYTINVEAFQTNMWGAQVLGLDVNIFYALVLVLVALIIVALVVVVARRKKSDLSK